MLGTAQGVSDPGERGGQRRLGWRVVCAAVRMEWSMVLARMGGHLLDRCSLEEEHAGARAVCNIDLVAVQLVMIHEDVQDVRGVEMISLQQ